ncbi:MULTISPECIES: phage tail protein [Stenotrophomonas]|uniref:Microcystin-dependent protein n=1 Tax=Stenotrophomonas maltophilia TaxID=40324 RepID=A0A2J0UB29_STEMA|nr:MULTISPECIES: tail fiber protein [Stenotrophomonas]PJL28277.1 microcystin-dependent protein [Stenotrophomonas maltophilia]HDS1144964.1 phage tail protein [Stenotrophomonas maltophilia]HDS1162357.1 phage tail protein [Stenotrophomonas maltophilia]
MSDPFTGEIQMFGFNFAPNNWAMCQGQLIPIQQNTALFSLLGVTFGGNGSSNFQLPDFSGNAACGQGNGPGLTPRVMGELFGLDTVTLLSPHMPAHSHGARIYNQPNKAHRSGVPAANDALVTPEKVSILAPTTTANSVFPPNTVGMTGGTAPHPNQQPYLTVNFCICLYGNFPQRP